MTQKIKNIFARDVNKEYYKVIIPELQKYISGKNLHAKVQKN